MSAVITLFRTVVYITSLADVSFHIVPPCMCGFGIREKIQCGLRFSDPPYAPLQMHLEYILFVRGDGEVDASPTRFRCHSENLDIKVTKAEFSS